ncbi:MAG TPA: leucine-rich repeat domain-containing protein [Phycisphaerae bacterium]|nr:leucine-rich repeat domain-containing protein [Phycisphaerae bacterium]
MTIPSAGNVCPYCRAKKYSFGGIGGVVFFILIIWVFFHFSSSQDNSTPQTVTNDISGSSPNGMQNDTVVSTSPNNMQTNVVVSGQQTLSVDIFAAWEKSGAQSGWMNTQGGWSNSITGQPGEVPAFRFTQLTSGIISQLPTPNKGFGIDLHNTNMTDSGLEELSGFTSLQSLDLSGDDQVTDMGLQKLAGLTQLQYLNLNGTQVTDASLQEIAGFTQLQTLNLDNTSVSDVGLKELVSLTQLHTLDLGDTQVSDTGLKELADLTQLRQLELMFASHVTDTGIAELQKALPNLQIIH